MASHLSCLGFPLEFDDAAQERMVRTALTGEQLRAGDGTYVRWSPDAGVELWLQLQDRELVGLAPHFAGSSTMAVGLIERVAREEAPLDGGFYGWAAPHEPDDPESGGYPFVFEMPDAARFAGLELPVVAPVQLAAFALELKVYESEAEFDADDPPDRIRFASESFIPVGTFPPHAGAEPRRSADA